jgi:hypothetical protein
MGVKKLLPLMVALVQNHSFGVWNALGGNHSKVANN